MVRRMLIGLAAFALVVGAASQASAQNWKVELPLHAGWNGSVTESSHQDEGVFGFVMNRGKLSKGSWGIGAEVRFGYEYDYSAEQKYLGLFRYENETTFKCRRLCNVAASNCTCLAFTPAYTLAGVNYGVCE